jgi:hypothetical protein
MERLKEVKKMKIAVLNLHFYECYKKLGSQDQFVSRCNEFGKMDQGSQYQTPNSKVDTGKSRKYSGVSRYR